MNELNNIGIAKFEKVSLDQFITDWCNTFGTTYSLRDVTSIYHLIQLPRRATDGSCGYDFYTPIAFDLKPGEFITIPTGVRCKINDYWGLFLYPRSGHGFKTGVNIANTVGLIDFDYHMADNEGHIFVKLTNNNECLNRNLKVNVGEAFCQGVFQLCGTTIDDNPVLQKRTGGMGSTTEATALASAIVEGLICY